MELLADKIRPSKLEDVVGQTHLIGKNKVISNLIENGRIFSMILYGPPGTGKTTLANVIVNELNLRFRMLNAVVNKKEDFDVVIAEAKMYGEIVLIVDEIHRMNKDKQDILLPYVENGKIILIGLTTSNPYFKINPAIRSRCQIFELYPLNAKDIEIGIKKIAETLSKCKIDDEAAKAISVLCGGDYRSALNLLEVSYYSTKNHHITTKVIESINSKPIVMTDKDEEYHYNLISAFQKSIRGSDADAALYYLGMLLTMGDLDIICRRLNVIAFEDIGLANPAVFAHVEAAIQAVERLGLPEARIPLADVVIELALSPKSNAGETAIDRAMSFIENGGTDQVPKHIRTNSPDYKYPHSYPKHWVDQQYLPNKALGQKFYVPCDNKYENGLNAFNKEMKK